MGSQKAFKNNEVNIFTLTAKFKIFIMLEHMISLENIVITSWITHSIITMFTLSSAKKNTFQTAYIQQYLLMVL